MPRQLQGLRCDIFRRALAALTPKLSKHCIKSSLLEPSQAPGALELVAEINLPCFEPLESRSPRCARTVWCLVGKGGMDPYSSSFLIPNSSPNNPFPHSLLRATQRSEGRGSARCLGIGGLGCDFRFRCVLYWKYPTLPGVTIRTETELEEIVVLKKTNC